MSKEKTIIYMLAIGLLLTVLMFTENTHEGVAVEMTDVSMTSAEPLKREKDKMLEVKSREDIAPKPVQVEEVLLDKAQNAESTEISEKVVRNVPRVERSKLIGGADVVWVEPKPKDPDNKFGEPPM